MLLKKLSIVSVFFLLILIICFSHSEKKEIIVGIQPLGGFDQELIDTVSNFIQKIYQFDVVVLKEVKIPKHAFVNIKSPRYRADSLIKYLKKLKPDSVRYIMGLTHKDISTTKRDGLGKVKTPKYKYLDWGIMGLGYCPGPSCIVSTYRLKSKRKSQLIDRFKKVSIHELGHNLGLLHCKTPDCVMQDAKETRKTVDKSKPNLCKKCRERLY